MMTILYNILAATTRQTSAIMLAATGGVYSNRAGLPNITLEASMIMGAFFAVYGSYTFSSSIAGVLAAVLVGVIMGSCFAFICLYLGGNNTVVGISFNLIAWGLTTFLLVAIYGTTGSFVSKEIVPLGRYSIPLLEKLPLFGGVFRNQTLITYFSWMFAFLSWVILFHTKLGLQIRACGENPQAVATVGYNVRKIRFICAVITSTLCGIAGTQLSLGLVTMFSERMTAGKGFIALAVVTYAKASLWKIVAVSVIFGLAEAVSILLKTLDYPSLLLQMIPYIVVVIFVASDPAIKYFKTRSKRKI